MLRRDEGKGRGLGWDWESRMTMKTAGGMGGWSDSRMGEGEYKRGV